MRAKTSAHVVMAHVDVVVTPRMTRSGLSSNCSMAGAQGLSKKKWMPSVKRNLWGEVSAADSALCRLAVCGMGFLLTK